MKKIIRKTIFAALVIVLMFSIFANWALLSDKRHLEKKLHDYTTIQQENKLLKERVKSCEQDLTDAATMLDAATRELQSLKKN
jgi:hypothetical protein